MFCKNCGNEIENEAPFCMKCGFKAGTGKQYCRHCGTKVEEGQGICVKCGFLLEEAKDEPHIQKNTASTGEEYKKYAHLFKREKLLSIIYVSLMLVLTVGLIFLPAFRTERELDLLNDFSNISIDDLSGLIQNDGKLVKDISLFDDLMTSLSTNDSEENKKIDKDIQSSSMVFTLCLVLSVGLFSIAAIATLITLVKEISSLEMTDESLKLKYYEMKQQIKQQNATFNMNIANAKKHMGMNLGVGAGFGVLLAYIGACLWLIPSFSNDSSFIKYISSPYSVDMINLSGITVWGIILIALAIGAYVVNTIYKKTGELILQDITKNELT